MMGVDGHVERQMNGERFCPEALVTILASICGFKYIKVITIIWLED